MHLFLLVVLMGTVFFQTPSTETKPESRDGVDMSGTMWDLGRCPSGEACVTKIAPAGDGQFIGFIHHNLLSSSWPAPIESVSVTMRDSEGIVTLAGEASWIQPILVAVPQYVVFLMNASGEVAEGGTIDAQIIMGEPVPSDQRTIFTLLVESVEEADGALIGQIRNGKAVEMDSVEAIGLCFLDDGRVLPFTMSEEIRLPGYEAVDFRIPLDGLEPGGCRWNLVMAWGYANQ